MRRSLRFLFYTNECVGLGHLRRTISLAQAVCELEPAATSLIITGAPFPPEQRLPKGVDTVKLPQLGRDVDGAQRPHRLEIGLARTRALRARLALAAAEGFQPDVAIVDKTPCGLGNELVPTLEALHRTPCRIALGLRDVEDGRDGVRRLGRGRPRRGRALLRRRPRLRPLVVAGRAEATLAEAIAILESLAGRRVLLERRAAQDGDVRRTGADTSLARSSLGWRPGVSLRAGLRSELDWVRARESLRRRRTPVRSMVEAGVAVGA